MKENGARQLSLFEGDGGLLETCRPDALPEQTRYRYEGCELAPSCLNCPLPLCRHDLPGGVRRQRLRSRDVEIARLRRECGLSVNDIARRFGLSRRSVFRALRQAQPVSIKPALDREQPSPTFARIDREPDSAADECPRHDRSSIHTGVRR